MLRYILGILFSITFINSIANANEILCGPDDRDQRKRYFENLDIDAYFTEFENNFDLVDQPICNATSAKYTYSPIHNLAFHAFLQTDLFIEIINYIDEHDGDKINVQYTFNDRQYTLFSAIRFSFHNNSGNPNDLASILEDLSSSTYQPQFDDITSFIWHRPEKFTNAVYDFETWKVFADFLLNYDALDVRNPKGNTWGVLEEVIKNTSYDELEYLLVESDFDPNKRLFNGLTSAHFVTSRTNYLDYIKVWNLLETFGVDDAVTVNQTETLLFLLTSDSWVAPHIVSDQKLEPNYKDFLLFLLRQGSPLIDNDNYRNEPMNLVYANISDVDLIGEFLHYTKNIDFELRTDGSNIFNFACQNNTHPEVFDLLISLGVDINNGRGEGYNCLHTASKFNPSVRVILPYLLNLDIPINKLGGKSGSYVSPIQESMQHLSNPYESFNILIKSGASLDRVVPEQIHPVITASAFAKDPRILEQLFKLGYKFDDFEQYAGLSPLNEAIAFNNLGSVNKILELGASTSFLAPVNASNSDPVSPLHATSMVRRPEKIIESLLSHGAPIDYQDNKKNTPLLWHILNKNERGSLHLINNGANVNLINEDGLSPILIAAREGLSKTLKLLVENGADTNVRSASGETPLIMFCTNNENNKSRNMSDILDTIFDLKVDVGTRDINGRDALVYCLSNGNISASEFLIEKGASLSRRYNAGNLVQHEILELMYTSTFQKIMGQSRVDKLTEQRIFEFLLDKITTIDGQNENGDTVLHLATKNGNTDLIELLISHGAKGSIKNLADDTPYDIASRNNLKNTDLIWKLNDLRYE